MLRVELSSVESASAMAWIDVAERALDSIARAPGALPFGYPREIDTTFRSVLAEWRKEAASAPRFTWCGEAEPEFLHNLLTYWFNLACLAEAKPSDIDVQRHPPEADAFYAVLVPRFIDALESDSAHANFARNLRERWPWPQR